MLDSRNEHSESQISTLDVPGPIDNSCESYVAMDDHSVKESAKHKNSSNLSDLDEIQFRPSKIINGDESGVCSPPLWSKSPPRNLVHPKPSPLNKMRNSPPSLRVQAITRGQKELMEMVKAMPESSYELSLKDLVDHQKVGNQEDEIVVDQEKSSFNITNKKASVRKQGSVRKQASVRKQPSLKKVEKMARTGSNISESNNTGLFLKLVFPMPFGGNKKKVVAKPKAKAKTKENPYAKVSTKLGDDNNSNILNDKSSNSVKKKEWWKRRYHPEDSESGGLSSNASSGSSGSSGSNDSSISNKSIRKKGGLLHGCSPFHSHKSNRIVE